MEDAEEEEFATFGDAASKHDDAAEHAAEHDDEPHDDDDADESNDDARYDATPHGHAHGGSINTRASAQHDVPQHGYAATRRQFKR